MGWTRPVQVEAIISVWTRGYRRASGKFQVEPITCNTFHTHLWGFFLHLDIHTDHTGQRSWKLWLRQPDSRLQSWYIYGEMMSSDLLAKGFTAISFEGTQNTHSQWRHSQSGKRTHNWNGENQFRLKPLYLYVNELDTVVVSRPTQWFTFRTDDPYWSRT